MRIGLLGDVMLGRGVGESLSTTPPEKLWSNQLREVIASCDVAVANLECCVSDRGVPTNVVRGKPFFFRAPPWSVDALTTIGVGAVSLANNHVLDYGDDALSDTLAHLALAGISSVGAGRGPEAARQGCVIAAEGRRLGIVAFADHPREFAATASDRLGIAYAAPLEEPPAWLLAEISRLRAKCDCVLCLPHWGANMTLSPTRGQRILASRLVHAGADLVAGHSAHVFHGVERRLGAIIGYDLGDALDDYAVDPELRNDLGLLAIWSPATESASAVLELIGLRLRYAHTDLASGEDADWIAARLENACAELGTALERRGEQRFHLR